MSEKDEKPIIVVIKRITKKTAHHGGSWKIAYADFVTAMMAFFMLLWMLSMMNKFQLQGISNYFKKPMKDIFIQNQMHNTVIPKFSTEHTEKSELAPTKTNKDGHSKETKPVTRYFQLEANSGSIDQEKVNATVHVAKVNIKDINKSNPTIQITMERAELNALKSKLEASMQSNPKINQFKEHLDFKVVDDGLKINIHSLKNKPMFSTGKGDFSNYASKIMKWLTGELKKSSRKITIIGHTDSEPYGFLSKYTNWELSADRANAVRRLLIDNGMKRSKIIRVEGAGSSSLLFKKDGHNPANRRVEIIILTDKATQRFINE